LGFVVKKSSKHSLALIAAQAGKRQVCLNAHLQDQSGTATVLGREHNAGGNRVLDRLGRTINRAGPRRTRNSRRDTKQGCQKFGTTGADQPCEPYDFTGAQGESNRMLW